MTINNGDTAFMMLATAMVCLMTPGLAFFTEDWQEREMFCT